MSVCLSVHPSGWNNSALTGRILMNFGILVFLKKSLLVIEVSLNSRMTGTEHEKVSTRYLAGFFLE
jgi:hypothetical protein